MEQSSLLVRSVSYKENGVLWIQYLVLYSQDFIFFLTFEWAYKLVLHYTRLERLAMDKQSSLLGELLIPRLLIFEANDIL